MLGRHVREGWLHEISVIFICGSVARLIVRVGVSSYQRQRKSHGAPHKTPTANLYKLKKHPDTNPSLLFSNGTIFRQMVGVHNTMCAPIAVVVPGLYLQSMTTKRAIGNHSNIHNQTGPKVPPRNYSWRIFSVTDIVGLLEDYSL